MEFKKLSRTIIVNGNEVQVDVTVKVEEDDIDPAGDFDFGDVAENKKYLERFRLGELFIGVITVEAKAHGESGSDVLGGCHLVANNYFDSKPFNKSVEEILESHDMVENALTELSNTLIFRANDLKMFATR